MGGDVERIKERLEIAEVVAGYVKLDKAGASFKGRCPFHNEKTPSFFVSPSRQSYYCFGCGAKGDIFTFVQEIEGLSFREALKTLAERAGIELSGRPENRQERGEKDKLLQALDVAADFFAQELGKSAPAKEYLKSRGISEESVKKWRLGYAPAEWRGLYSHLMSLGFQKETLIKAGLIKIAPDGSGKEPYDVFRDRLIFPLCDANGETIAFSGRALQKETVPKYLNSPDTALFTKSEVLYGLDKAKEKIRKANFAILVEGQVDLVLSHQSGVENTVASSGTAFTQAHLERLKRLSKRIILAFDGDAAGDKAAERAAELALALGLEVKLARLPEGSDPAELVQREPQAWKEVLKNSLPAAEALLDRIIAEETDARKRSLAVRRKILPLLTLLESAMERSHFVSLIARRTGIKEELVWEDLKKTPKPDLSQAKAMTFVGRVKGPNHPTPLEPAASKPRREMIEEKLSVVRQWLKEEGVDEKSLAELKKEEVELETRLSKEDLGERLSELQLAIVKAEALKDHERAAEIAKEVHEVLKKIGALEEKVE